MAFAVETCPDPSSKCCEDQVSDEGMRKLEEGVNFNLFCILAPFLPIFLSSFGSRHHNSKVNCFPCRDDITHEVNFCGKQNSSQEVSCGKNVLKKFKSVSEHACNFESELNRDATLAMSFLLPGIEHTSSGAKPQSCCQSANARSKCRAIFDRAVNFWTNELPMCCRIESLRARCAWKGERIQVQAMHKEFPPF